MHYVGLGSTDTDTDLHARITINDRVLRKCNQTTRTRSTRVCHAFSCYGKNDVKRCDLSIHDHMYTSILASRQ